VKNFATHAGGLKVLLKGQQITPFVQGGQAVPPLSGEYWYHGRGAPSSDNAWPRAGHVSLLVMFDRGIPLRQVGTIRRLATQYGSKGLVVTLVTKTQGYWLKSGPNTGPIPPTEEAAHDSAYYLDYLHLPVNLVVTTTRFRRDAEHRLAQANPVQYESAYQFAAAHDFFGGSGGLSIVLADRTGHYIIKNASMEEGELFGYVARALSESHP
jgi:hypothetical protein